VIGERLETWIRRRVDFLDRRRAAGDQGGVDLVVFGALQVKGCAFTSRS